MIVLTTRVNPEHFILAHSVQSSLLYKASGGVCSREMQVPSEQASMSALGHVFDPYLSLIYLDLYTETAGHLPPMSFVSLFPCSCALAANSCFFFQPWMLQAVVSVLFSAKTGCLVPPCLSARETVKREAAAMTLGTG